MKANIDVNFSFTNDINYWETFNTNNSSRGCPDPDCFSPKLRSYHQKLWSQKLPNGDEMELKEDPDNYLVWKDFCFGSDSIVNMYFHHMHVIKYYLTDELKNTFCQKYGFNDFTSFYKDYLLKSYTIGGAIIFPKNNSINTARWRILKDRFDLTLECIRLYYLGIENPLSKELNANKAFFDLFVNFQQYVDFFYLQDLVSNNDTQNNDTQIKYFNAEQYLSHVTYPQNTQNWIDLYENQLQFVHARNQRIAAIK